MSELTLESAEQMTLRINQQIAKETQKILTKQGWWLTSCPWPSNQKLRRVSNAWRTKQQFIFGLFE